MHIGIYLDNNIWDFLFDRQIDLATELPSKEFTICITREAEFEIPPISRTKPELAKFIENTISRCLIKTDVFFGFNDPTLLQSEQRVGGFEVGRFASNEELEFMTIQRTPLRPRHGVKNSKTGLFKDEADISVAARSFTSVVLSLDAKSGPINDAYQQGGKVVFVTNFDKSGLTLRDFVKRALIMAAEGGSA